MSFDDGADPPRLADFLVDILLGQAIGWYVPSCLPVKGSDCSLNECAALFGRPPIISLRVTDTPEPLIVDDENLTNEGVKPSTTSGNSRMEAFVATIRLHVILEVGPGLLFFLLLLPLSFLR